MSVGARRVHHQAPHTHWSTHSLCQTHSLGLGARNINMTPRPGPRRSLARTTHTISSRSRPPPSCQPRSPRVPSSSINTPPPPPPPPAAPHLLLHSSSSPRRQLPLRAYSLRVPDALHVLDRLPAHGTRRAARLVPRRAARTQAAVPARDEAVCGQCPSVPHGALLTSSTAVSAIATGEAGTVR